MVLDQKEGTDFTSRVYGILEEDGTTALNQFHLVEGRLPSAPNECIVESVFGKYSGESIAIGDHLLLSEGNVNYESLGNSMTETELIIVGICESPLCISVEGDATTAGSGSINLHVFVSRSFFTMDYDTDLFVSVRDADTYSTFSDSYQDYVQSVIEDLKPLGDSLRNARIQVLQSGSQDLLETLYSLQNQVQQITAIQDTLSQSLPEEITQTKQLQQMFSGSPLSDALGTTSLLLEDAISESMSAESLSSSLSQNIDNTEALLERLSHAAWIFRTRLDLAGINSYSDNVGKVSALAKIFPVFFFVVALLVALTTMTRLIEEKRLQIGTLKALGFSNLQILNEYLLFSLTASILGCAIGFLVGFRIFPHAISSAYGMMYILPSIDTPLRWDIIAWVAPVTIGSILLAALWSCWNEFRSMPASLMIPKSPVPGKRIWLEHIPFIWSRLSFTHKVTARNLFRYKKRFIMTVIGVAGCSALLLTGFGVRDSVNDIVDKQFGEIYRFGLLFTIDSPSSLETDNSLRALLSDSESITADTIVCQENGNIYVGSNKQEVTFFIPSDPSVFPDFITLRNRKSRNSYTISSDGIILTEKLCEEMNIHPGDRVILEDAEGHQASAEVLGVTENYVSSLAYFTEDLYLHLFGSVPSYTNLLCKTSHSDSTSDTEEDDRIASLFLSNDHVIYGRSVASLKSSFADSISSINGVILVLILAAGLLCIVVLYNLFNVNICERKKELATLQVLGFYKTETQNYIFRETNLLSFIGAVIGLFVGIWLHSFVVRTVEVNHIMFGRDIKPLSYVISLAISIVFTLLVDLIMKRPINHTDMVEAMKAND